MNPVARTMGRLAAIMIAVAAAERAMAQQATPAMPEQAPVEHRIVVNIPATTLELYEGGQRVKTYRIAVGKRITPTPVGSFRVVNLVKNPTWYGPEQVVAAGPKNPVGTRWIGLDRKGYGIHGTNAPKSIGRAASHGCIRLRNADAEDLFTRLRVGDPVEIIYETAPAGGTQLNDIYKRNSSEAPATSGGGS